MAGHPPTHLIWISTTLALCAASSTHGQSTQESLLNRLEQEMLDAQIEQRLADYEGQTAFERMTFDYGTSLRVGIAGLQNSTGQDSTMFQYEANLFANMVVDGGHRFFGNLRFLYNQYDVHRGSNEDGFLIPYGNRYWYEFDLKGLQRATEGGAGDVGLKIRAGRMFSNWNSGAIYSNDLYGVRMRGDWEQWSWEAIFGRTASSGFYDFDPGRPSYDSNTNRLLYGVRGAYAVGSDLELFVSNFWQRDHNDPNVQTVDIGGIVYQHDFTYNSQYLSLGGSGTVGPEFLWTAEFIHETGRGTSRMQIQPDLTALQTTEDISAWAGVVNMAWTPSGIATRPRMDATIAFGTGDNDRFTAAGSMAGNTPGTQDRSFQSLGYVNTGLAAAPTLSNLMMLRVGASTGVAIDPRRPDALRMGLDVFVYGQQDSNAPMSIPTGSGTFAGWALDGKVDWRLTSDVSFTVRGGVYFPPPGVAPAADFTRHFVYGGFTYAF
ncbi:MAG: alginate export family protein [Phycisphaerales bacterium]|nr:alginate export family protein [Phycisphaerales bacterium]